MSKFYDLYNDRLPPSLKLYLHLKHERHYANSGSHFEFAVDKIPQVLKIWGEISELTGLLSLIHSGGRVELLKTAIEMSINKLRALLTALDEGMTEGLKNRPSDDVRVNRSIFMHETAEKLKGKNIAWKVGNLHIKDILGLESGGFIKTNYAYITKENFNTKNLNKGEMDSFVGGDVELGPEYVEAEQVSADMLTNARAILADPEKMKVAMSNEPEWDAVFASIEHLDLSNLITNATGIIVDAILKGKIPKLKSISIPKQSMTPDLNGKLLGYGIKVNLV
ncbi:MAG: hypothetical protein JKY22_07915 [Flavobacteriaceae bacterium]|nr:hypothetical protein [Flavobacteriaceae bacterium]